MFHPATKLVIVTEQYLSSEVCRIIETCGGKGYTLVPAGGKGLHHQHPLEKATVVEGFDNLKIEVVCRDRATAENIAERVIRECFPNQPGVLYLEKVEICREERF